MSEHIETKRSIKVLYKYSSFPFPFLSGVPPVHPAVMDTCIAGSQSRPGVVLATSTQFVPWLATGMPWLIPAFCTLVARHGILPFIWYFPRCVVSAVCGYMSATCGYCAAASWKYHVVITAHLRPSQRRRQDTVMVGRRRTAMRTQTMKLSSRRSLHLCHLHNTAHRGDLQWNEAKLQQWNTWTTLIIREAAVQLLTGDLKTS